MKKAIFLIFILCFVCHGYGQEADTTWVDSTEVVDDYSDEDYEDTTVSPPTESGDYEASDYAEPAYFPADSMESVKGRPEYGYMKNLDSLLRNLKLEVAEKKKSKVPSTSIFDSKIIKILFWAAAIFAVLFILYQLFGGQQNLFYRNKKLKINETEPEEGISEASHLVLSQQAAARGDYRVAVRHQYSYVLELMGEKKLLLLQPQKTNDHYLKEVRQLPLSSDFAKLTLQFEYIWYGEFQLNEQQYKTISEGYRKFIGTWL